MISKKNYNRNSKILAAKSAVRRSIKLLTSKKPVTSTATGAVSTIQRKYHHHCIQIDMNKNMFEDKYSKMKTPNKAYAATPSKIASNYRTPIKAKTQTTIKAPQTLPTKLYNLRRPNLDTNTPTVKLATTDTITNTPKNKKDALLKYQDKNAKTINVLTKTPLTRTRLQLQQEQCSSSALKTPSKHHHHQQQEEKPMSQSLKKSETTAKTPLSTSKHVTRKLFSTDVKPALPNSTSKCGSSIKARIAAGARRSLGFLKKASSTTSLNKANAAAAAASSKIPRFVGKPSNLVINKVQTEVEVFKQVADILDQTENRINEDKVVEVPIHALKILYNTPNRDILLKTIKRIDTVLAETQPLAKEVEVETQQPPKQDEIIPVNEEIYSEPPIEDKVEEEIKMNDSIDGDERIDEVEDEEVDLIQFDQELENQNQIEVLENEILVNNTPIANEENEKRMLKMMDKQQRSSNLTRTSEISSPFGMNNVFKAQNGPKPNEIITPSGLKRIFKSKLKSGEHVTPFSMKNLFKQHKPIHENLTASPYTMKNLFKQHQQENIGCDGANATPYSMRNLFRQHNKKHASTSDIRATPFSMKNLFRQHGISSGDLHATPFSMKSLFKHQKSKIGLTASPFSMKDLSKHNKEHLVNDENASPCVLKAVNRNINKENQDIQATPLSMKNLFKLRNKKHLSQNLNGILSPTVFNVMFDENAHSPLADIAKRKEMRPMTPIDRIDHVCEQVINNEMDIKQVQNELEKIGTGDLISHIIELKQQVMALDQFSEQLIDSIVDDECEAMSVQYADDDEDDNEVENDETYEEVILSVDCITSEKPVVIPEEMIKVAKAVTSEVNDVEIVYEEEVVTEATTTTTTTITVNAANDEVEIQQQAQPVEDSSNVENEQGEIEVDIVHKPVEEAVFEQLEHVESVKETDKPLENTLPIESEQEEEITNVPVEEKEMVVEQVEQVNESVVGEDKIFTRKLKGVEHVTPFSMKNLFKQHRQVHQNLAASPCTMKNLFKQQEEIAPLIEPVEEKVVVVEQEVIEADDLFVNEQKVIPVEEVKEVDETVEQQEISETIDESMDEILVSENEQQTESIETVNSPLEEGNIINQCEEVIITVTENPSFKEVTVEVVKETITVINDSIIDEQVESAHVVDNEQINQADEVLNETENMETIEKEEENTEIVENVVENNQPIEIIVEAPVVVEQVETIEEEQPVKNKRGGRKNMAKVKNVPKAEEEEEIVHSQEEQPKKTRGRKVKAVEEDEVEEINDDVVDGKLAVAQQIEQPQEVKKTRGGRRGKAVESESIQQEEQHIDPFEIKKLARKGTRAKKEEVVEVIDETPQEVEQVVEEKPKATKRGGRGKKAKEIVDEDDHLSQASEVVAAEVVEEEPKEEKKTRRGGGRKKKDESIEEENEIIEAKPKPVTKRGGKRGKAEETDVISSNLNQLQELLQIEEEEAIEPVAAKKTRRGKKQVEEEIIPDEEPVIEEAAKKKAPAAKKTTTRGGKAKQVAAAAVEEEDEQPIVEEAPKPKGRAPRKKKEQEEESIEHEPEVVETKPKGRGKQLKSATTTAEIPVAPTKNTRTRKNVEPTTTTEEIETKPTRKTTKRKTSMDSVIDETTESIQSSTSTRTTRAARGQNKKLKL